MQLQNTLARSELTFLVAFRPKESSCLRSSKETWLVWSYSDTMLDDSDKGWRPARPIEPSAICSQGPCIYQLSVSIMSSRLRRRGSERLIKSSAVFYLYRLSSNSLSRSLCTRLAKFYDGKSELHLTNPFFGDKSLSSTISNFSSSSPSMSSTRVGGPPTRMILVS